jgi:murein DD-endopeptidase MepM/ murein hydrolase activator NlpD
MNRRDSAPLLPLLLMLFSLVASMRLRRLVIRAVSISCAVAGALAVGVHPVPTGAQTPDPNRMKALREEILDSGVREVEAQRELQAIRDRRAPIEARVKELDGQIASIQARLAPLEAEATRLGLALEDAQAKFLQRQAEFEVAKAEFDGSAAQIYRSARRGVTFDYVTAARPQDLVQGSKYLDEVNAKQRSEVKRISALRDEIDAQRKAIAASKADADAAAAEVARLRDQAVALRAEIEPARAEAARAQAAEENQVAAIRQGRMEDERELAELQAISDAIAAQLRTRASQGQGIPGGCLVRPVPGAIVSGFGNRTNPIGGGSGFHAGVDMSSPSGTPIKACRSGTVVIASAQGGYGNTVVLDHGGNMATLYGHQSRIAVSVGAQVTVGDVIGYVGSTGNSTGPHLHFEVRITGNPVDPVPYL